MNINVFACVYECIGVLVFVVVVKVVVLDVPYVLVKTILEHFEHCSSVVDRPCRYKVPQVINTNRSWQTTLTTFVENPAPVVNQKYICIRDIYDSACIFHHVPPWPNGQGVGLLIRRLRAQVPQGVLRVPLLGDGSSAVLGRALRTARLRAHPVRKPCERWTCNISADGRCTLQLPAAQPHGQR